ncbi:hypothetical protein BOX15_Mlig016265g1, partial [Macrostomum lignano]
HGKAARWLHAPLKFFYKLSSHYCVNLYSSNSYGTVQFSSIVLHSRAFVQLDNNMRQSILLLLLGLCVSSIYSSGESTFREVCYDGLGCFSTRGNFYDSVNRPIQVLPQDPDRIRPTFALYTRRNVNTAQNLVYNNRDSVRKSNFRSSVPTKIIIHGFTDNGNSDWNKAMKVALLNAGDYNVIQLDWSQGNGYPYTLATANTRVIGALVAQFIVWLESNFGANRENFHLIGHSLGAHVSGYAGERLSTGSKKLGRITGMDPAGPYFEYTHPEVRLDPTDARFVDAIHTDGDSTLSIIKLSGGFGLMQPVGHVDFYPNGGKSQPNCNEPPSDSVSGIIGGTVWRMTCSHNRVRAMMISTIANPRRNYVAYPCASYEDFKAGRCRTCGTTGCASMGMRAAEWRPNGRVNVKMFLDTAGTEPFESRG